MLTKRVENNHFVYRQDDGKEFMLVASGPDLRTGKATFTAEPLYNEKLPYDMRDWQPIKDSIAPGEGYVWYSNGKPRFGGEYRHALVRQPGICNQAQTNPNLLGEITIPAGTLRCYKNADPEQPGFSILLQPKGCDFEIDMAEVSTYLESGYSVDEETPEDVAIMVWADPTTEERTEKYIVHGSEIQEMVTATMGEEAELSKTNAEEEDL